MGELHLDIYIERMKREYNVECVTGKPRVAFRETITKEAAFNYTHKKQTGGSGQYAKVIGRIEPMERDEETGKDIAFESRVVGGVIPVAYFPGIEKVRSNVSSPLGPLHTDFELFVSGPKGFNDSIERGQLTGHPIVGCRFIIEDGQTHVVDSSELAFRQAAQGAFREAYMKASPVVLEPIMKVEVVAPIEFQGEKLRLLNKLRNPLPLEKGVGVPEN
jgi:elongation factor G